MPRPEHIACIRRVPYPQPIEPPSGQTQWVTWCGRAVPCEFTFGDLEHAHANAQTGGRLVVCRNCIRTVAHVLRAHGRATKSGDPRA